VAEESPSENNIETLANEISRYLHQHQFAADTVEGICHWWITKQRIAEEQKRVLAALDYLIEHRQLSRRKLPDGSLLYSALDVSGNEVDKH